MTALSQISLSNLRFLESESVEKLVDVELQQAIGFLAFPKCIQDLEKF